MPSDLRLTVREVADSIARTTGKRHPIWKLRRVIDGLDDRDLIDVQRIGLYRAIASSDISIIAEAVDRVPGVLQEPERA